jgi:hypothetical protein
VSVPHQYYTQCVILQHNTAWFEAARFLHRQSLPCSTLTSTAVHPAARPVNLQPPPPLPRVLPQKTAGTMHAQVLAWKVDLDIAGTQNSVKLHTVKVGRTEGPARTLSCEKEIVRLVWPPIQAAHCTWSAKLTQTGLGAGQ